MKPVLWLLGGFDPTGGAGILRDLCTAWSFSSPLHVQAAVTAWTRQGCGQIASSQRCHPLHLQTQLSGFLPPQGIKLGLVPGKEIIQVVLPKIAEAAEQGCFIVLDPVMMASDGGDLGGTVEGYRLLARYATLVTPNRLEAAKFAETSVDDPRLLVRTSESLGAHCVLLKGGHHPDPEWVKDELWLDGKIYRFVRKRQPGPDPRGTGCALATRISCELLYKQPLITAIETAIAWLDRARQHCGIGVDGKAHLPVKDLS